MRKSNKNDARSVGTALPNGKNGKRMTGEKRTKDEAGQR
jgi:hypothetical protein